MKGVSLKLEKEFLNAIEKIMKKHNYMTKTEFIRESIRDKIKKLEEKEITKEKETISNTHSTVTERKELPSYI